MSNPVTPWTVAHQATLPMGFSRQGYRTGLPCPSPGDCPDPHLLCLLCWRVDSLSLHHLGSPCVCVCVCVCIYICRLQNQCIFIICTYIYIYINREVSVFFKKAPIIYDLFPYCRCGCFPPKLFNTVGTCG